MNITTLYRFLLLATVLSCLPACSQAERTSDVIPQTLFSVSEHTDEDELTSIRQIDWSWSNKLTIQGFTLVDLPVFIGDASQHTISPIYFDNAVLSAVSVPKLSKDGRYLAVQTFGKGIIIASLESVASRSYQLVPESYIAVFEVHARCNLDWSSDSEQLAVICLTQNGIKISVFDLSTKKLEDLFEYSEDLIDKVEGMSWSPDESMIAFSLRYGYNEVAQEVSQTDMFIYDLKKESLLRLTKGHDASERSPEWYPGSEILTFATTPADDAESLDARLEFSTSDGSCVKLLPNLSGFVYPSWSPDGSHLAYISEWESIKVLETSKFVPPEFLTPEGLCKAAN